MRNTTDSSIVMGTVKTAQSGSTRPTVITDASQTAVSVWAGNNVLAVNDRVVCQRVNGEVFIIGVRK